MSARLAPWDFTAEDVECGCIAGSNPNDGHFVFPCLQHRLGVLAARNAAQPLGVGDQAYTPPPSPE